MNGTGAQVQGGVLVAMISFCWVLKEEVSLVPLLIAGKRLWLIVCRADLQASYLADVLNYMDDEGGLSTPGVWTDDREYATPNAYIRVREHALPIRNVRLRRIMERSRLRHDPLFLLHQHLEQLLPRVRMKNLLDSLLVEEAHHAGQDVQVIAVGVAADQEEDAG